MEDNFNIGDIVLSKAGRDKDRYFVVVATENIFAFVCDGDLRKTDNPKKKKFKHLKATGAKSEYVEEKLIAGVKVTNAELRRTLSEFEDSISGANTETEKIN